MSMGENLITKTDQKYIVKMREAGFNFTQISKVFGVSADTVYRHYKLAKGGNISKTAYGVDWSKVRTGLGNVPRGDD